MSEFTFTSGKRTGRVFTRTEGSRAAPPNLPAFFEDDDDKARDKMFARIFKQYKIVSATAHPVTGREGEMHVFFSSPSQHARLPKIFACVVISKNRLKELLNSGRDIVEGFTLQVADSETLGRNALQQSLWRWINRTYPGRQSVRALRVSIYADPLSTAFAIKSQVAQLLDGSAGL